jgi:hypothetical protein
VLDSSLGDMGSDVLESIVGGNLDSLSGLLPGLEIPVTLEESIPIAGLNAGVVQVKGGSLPLKVSLAEVIPIKERLWILLDVSAGPWTIGPAGAAGVRRAAGVLLAGLLAIGACFFAWIQWRRAQRVPPPTAARLAELRAERDRLQGVSAPPSSPAASRAWPKRRWRE